MNTAALSSIQHRPAPLWLRDLAHGRAAYEELLGWPVSVRVSERVLCVAVGNALSAVSMPAPLGALVRKELGVALQCGPVFSDPDGARWSFLTRPPEELRPGVAGELARFDVAVAGRGAHLVVPTSPSGGSVVRTWRWLEPPAPGRSLPPAYPVIAVVRRLAERPDMAA
ncbi:hypothetical protein [Actinophytocola xanthii]|uniref:DNA primase/polymerase bifunctional N-terminal domain-containing protein n=1 Tax=Actinophytocola xanthii TaxID=1912961 RepID=A0A1Q8BUN3_9PSEU|nr:hypothetical protein [Actinophytocola xanthii]OLF05803.1 hypothetical protein BU204_36875 [Actinophytocola xanthii]